MAWGSVRLDIRKRNRLLMEVVTAEDCQEHLDRALRHMVWCYGLPCAGAGIRLDDPSGVLPAQDVLRLYSMSLWMKYEWEFKYVRKEWFMAHRLASHQDPNSLKFGFTGDFAQVRKSSFKKDKAEPNSSKVLTKSKCSLKI